MNRIILIGRLTRDPETKSLDSGSTISIFDLAVDRDFKTANGEKQTDFFKCVSWNNTAIFVSTYIKKGYLVGIEGQLQSRQYVDKEGSNRIAFEINVSNLQNLTPKNEAIANTTVAKDTKKYDVDISDADLPF